MDSCAKNTFLQKVSLYFLIAFAIISIAVYVSGLGSEDLVKTLPGVSKSYLQLHEKVARISSLTVWFVGGLTVLGLAFLRGREQLFSYFVRGIFAMSLLCTGLFVLTGYLGGQITHAEIRSTLAQGSLDTGAEHLASWESWPSFFSRCSCPCSSTATNSSGGRSHLLPVSLRRGEICPSRTVTWPGENRTAA